MLPQSTHAPSVPVTLRMAGARELRARTSGAESHAQSLLSHRKEHRLSYLQLFAFIPPFLAPKFYLGSWMPEGGRVASLLCSRMVVMEPR